MVTPKLRLHTVHWNSDKEWSEFKKKLGISTVRNLDGAVMGFYHRIRGEGWQCATCGLILESRMAMQQHSIKCKRVI